MQRKTVLLKAKICPIGVHFAYPHLLNGVWSAPHASEVPQVENSLIFFIADYFNSNLDNV